MSRTAEDGFPAAPLHPLFSGSDLAPGSKKIIIEPIPTESNPPESADDSALSEGRKQLKLILDRKLGRATDPVDPRNADSLEFPLDVSDIEGRKDLSWSALLGQGVNQSMGEEGLGENRKDVIKSKVVPSPRVNQLKPVLSETQKPASKSVSSKGSTPRNKEVPKRQEARVRSEDKDDLRGGQPSRSPRKQLDIRNVPSPRSDDLGSLSERTPRTASAKQNPIVQRALKDRERRSGLTPVPLNSASARTFTETSEGKGYPIISPRSLPEDLKDRTEDVPLTTNLRLPETPKLPLNLAPESQTVGIDESKGLPLSPSPRDLTITSPRDEAEAESTIKTRVSQAEIPIKTSLKPPLSPKKQVTDPTIDSFPQYSPEIFPSDQEKSVSVAKTGPDFSYFPQYIEEECQTEEHFDQKLWRVLDLLSDKKVMKGLRLVGGLSQYLQSCGYQS